MKNRENTGEIKYYRICGKPNISIVTPFYNAEQNFIQTYYCVVNQSMEAFEWIIVDDGSSRPSAVELLEEYGKRMPVSV